MLHFIKILISVNPYARKVCAERKSVTAKFKTNNKIRLAWGAK